MGELIVLRIVHVAGGAAWFGAIFFTTLFLLPVLGKAGPAAAGPVTAGLMERKFFVVMPSVALLVILSGLRLMQLTSDGFAAGYFGSAMGRTYLAGAVAATVAFVVGYFVQRPAMQRAGALMAGMAQASPDERAAIQRDAGALRARANTAARVVFALLTIAALAMAVARYL